MDACSGIGKSMLGYLLLYKWCCDGKRVVVRKAGWRREQPHLFCEEGAFKLNDAAFEEELDRPDVM